jgi:TIR domain-containing protein/LGFP repeat-containing protein
MSNPTHRPVEIFFSYSHKDEDFRNELEKQLSVLKRNGMIAGWHDRKIVPGAEWSGEIDKHLEMTNIILLLISADFIASDYCYEIEMKRAMERHENGEARVLPIILRPCDWRSVNHLAKLQALPKDAKPISTWNNKDEALLDVVEGIKNVIKDLNPSSAKFTPKVERGKIAKEAIEKKKHEVEKSRLYNLGEPKKDEEVGPSPYGATGIARIYEHGLVVWCENGQRPNQALAVYGAVGYRYKKMGSDRWNKLGFPTTDEEDASSPYGSKGRRSLFENGVIFWYESGNYYEQTYVIDGPIGQQFLSLGNSDCYLGFPISDPYPISGGKRCDFEGGAILRLDSDKVTSVVRQLLRINYSDSPLNHEWRQQVEPGSTDRVTARIEPTIGRSKNYIGSYLKGDREWLQYPADGFKSNEVKEMYCGITFKSLNPGAWVRIYIRVKTSGGHDQYLEFDPRFQKEERDYQANDDAEYWKVPLPERCNDGQWHTLIVDLRHETQVGFAKSFEWLRRFRFRGHIGVADLIVSDNCQAIEQIAIDPIRLR